MNAPLVSAVIATYNRPAGLRAALAGVAAQSVAELEVVVVNDAGVDVHPIVAEYRHRIPIRLITLPVNRGLAVARKAGIAATRGRYLAFCDDDDLWLPDHLATALDGVDGAGVDMVYTACLVAYRVHTLGSGEPVAARYRFDQPFDPQLLAVTNPIPVLTVVSRTFDPTGADLDPHGALQEDWAMWLGLVNARRWRLRYLPATTTVYHRIPTTASMTGAAASSGAAIRRFAAGHRRLHQRWPVPPDSPAGRARPLPHHMYRLVAGRHDQNQAVSHYYYERSLPLIAGVVRGDLTPAAAAAALTDAVAPDAIELEEAAAA